MTEICHGGPETTMRSLKRNKKLISIIEIRAAHNYSAQPKELARKFVIIEFDETVNNFFKFHESRQSEEMFVFFCL